jgi:hypothetical protein
MSALLTMRGWMFLGQFTDLREYLLSNYDLRSVGDVDRGAFEDVPNEVLAASMTLFRKSPLVAAVSVAIQPTPLNDRSYDRERTKRKRAALLAQIGRHEFDPHILRAIEGGPIVYWWNSNFITQYKTAHKLGDVHPARFGLTTGDNDRFVRFWYEIGINGYFQFESEDTPSKNYSQGWVAFVLGGKGRSWIEPLTEICRWFTNGLEVKEKCVAQYGSVSKQIRNEAFYFKRGVAFSMIGNAFSARVHRYRSVFGNKGSSVFPSDLAATVCLMNKSLSTCLSGLPTTRWHDYGRACPIDRVNSDGCSPKVRRRSFRRTCWSSSGCSPTRPRVCTTCTGYAGLADSSANPVAPSGSHSWWPRARAS